MAGTMPCVSQVLAIPGLHTVRHLGGGAKSAVFAAVDVATGAPLAVKMRLAADVAAWTAARFEGAALSASGHPALVRGTGPFADPAGRPYCRLSLVPGETLRARLWQRPATTDEVVALARRLGAGLASLHRAGLAHGDLAPDNVMVPGGAVRRAVLLDLGSARAFATPAGPATLSYAAPEIRAGAPVSAASDLYALGRLLRTALTGGAPPEPVPFMLAGAANSLARVLDRWCAEDPDRRPDSVAKALEELTEIG